MHAQWLVGCIQTAPVSYAYVREPSLISTASHRDLREREFEGKERKILSASSPRALLSRLFPPSLLRLFLLLCSSLLSSFFQYKDVQVEERQKLDRQVSQARQEQEYCAGQLRASGGGSGPGAAGGGGGFKASSGGFHGTQLSKQDAGEINQQHHNLTARYLIKVHTSSTCRGVCGREEHVLDTAVPLTLSFGVFLLFVNCQVRTWSRVAMRRGRWSCTVAVSWSSR